MKRRVIVVGGIIICILAGGAVVYGATNNAIGTAHNVAVIVPISSVATSANIIAPSATTLKAKKMTSSTATFYGIIHNASGVEVSYWFEFSADPLLGQILIRRTPRVILDTDSNTFSVEADATALSNSTKYYVRLVIKNSAGRIIRGERISFNTI